MFNAEPNKVIHQPARLKVCAALNALEPSGSLDFQQLKKILGLTDGNLGSHLNTLEEAGYINIIKSFNGKKPCTQVQLSNSGRKAFREHLSFLKSIVEEGKD